MPLALDRKQEIHVEQMIFFSSKFKANIYGIRSPGVISKTTVASGYCAPRPLLILTDFGAFNVRFWDMQKLKEKERRKTNRSLICMNIKLVISKSKFCVFHTGLIGEICGATGWGGGGGGEILKIKFWWLK